MPNKSFSIYSEQADGAEGNLLTIEVARSHIALIVTKPAAKSVVAYEMFDFKDDEGPNFEKLFADVSLQSKILDRSNLAANIYINNEYCLPVPILKFNTEIAAEYLDVVFGENPFSKIQFEHLAIEPGIMNVYRVNESQFHFLTQKFLKVTFHHTYSNILKRLASASLALPEEFINVQFYNTFMIAVVIKGGNVQLIQTFVYEMPEDVLYYLLNITRQFEMDSGTMTIQISGMIDLDFKLYREVITYFKKVMVENITESNLLLQVNEYPLHYFTPFFNLAL